MNTKITEWSELYGIDEETMDRMHSAEDSLGICYNNPDLIDKVFHKNSQLLQEFLSSLPTPSKSSSRIGLNIDFLFPTPEAYSTLFESIFPPREHFKKKKDELATLFWNEHGTEFYTGPIDAEKKRLILPTYVEAYGFGEKGIQKLVYEEMPKMLEREFFVYTFALGECNDHRKSQIDFGHDDLGVGTHVLNYLCHQGVYNPSGGLSKHILDFFYDKKAIKTIEQKVQELNARFFQREKKKQENPYYFSPLQLLSHCKRNESP